MALVDRTAYPRLPSRVSARELAEAFTPTVQETSWACTKVVDPGTRLALLVMLKCYRRLGYFPGWSGCHRRWSSTSTPGPRSCRGNAPARWDGSLGRRLLTGTLTWLRADGLERVQACVARGGAAASLLAPAGFAADHDTARADGRSCFMLLSGAPWRLAGAGQ